MYNNCIICLDSIFIPVEFICFSCYKNTEINCSSLVRVCLKCANHFLQLDRNIDERDFYKKCIYCPSLTYLHKLHFENAYKKDFLLMMNDSNAYPCPYCFVFSGTQIEIEHHLEKECPKYYILCECKKVFIKEDFYFHLFQCNKHISCPLCKKFILKRKMMEHMSFLHHHVFCNLCKLFIPKDGFDLHIENECPERLVICAFCLQLVVYSKYKDHLFDHKNEVLVEMKELTDKYNVILDRYNQINRLLKPSHLLE